MKTGVGLYSGAKGLPSPVSGPACTLAAEERRLCPPSRPAASDCHQHASSVEDVCSRTFAFPHGSLTTRCPWSVAVGQTPHVIARVLGGAQPRASPLSLCSPFMHPSTWRFPLQEVRSADFPCGSSLLASSPVRAPSAGRWGGSASPRKRCCRRRWCSYGPCWWFLKDGARK